VPQTIKRTVAEITPFLEAKQTTRELKIAGWETTARRHWNSAPSQIKQKQNVNSKIPPVGSMFIFPSTDPYTAKQRADFRAIHENVSWINRAVRIMVACVTGWGFTISIEPRAENEQMEDELLDRWKLTKRFNLPGIETSDELTELEDDQWSGGLSVAELEKWLMDYSVSLDLQSHISRASRYTLEQGNCGIAMLPEMKLNEEGVPDEKGEYVLPKILRTIRPEHVVKIWLNTKTGEMSHLQTIGISSNGGKLDAQRLIWLMSEMNLELNTDYYGESRMLPLLDIGKVQAILYGKDFTEAAMYTWHQPKIFRVEIPPRDYKRVSTVLKEFLRNNNNAQGRDIAVTQSVEPISQTTNTGDLSGLLALDDHLIDQVAGFFNIPPFLLSKGKAGNLGGNANAEEIDAFLNIEVRPNQEIIENFIEKQFFDRILKIIFREDDLENIPVKAKLEMKKPEISTLFDREQYEIMLDLVSKNLMSKDKLMERMNLSESQKDLTISSGGDDDPSLNAWPRTSRRKNRHWNARETWSGNGAHLIKTQKGMGSWGLKDNTAEKLLKQLTTNSDKVKNTKSPL
jgi:hypothetical protein